MSKSVEVGLTDTLMAWNNELEVHLSAGERHSTYYFRVPDAWGSLAQGDLDDKVMGVMREIYNAFNEGFRQAEPNDINYLAPLAVTCRVLSAEEEEQKPWMTARSPAVWEWTPCVAVREDGKYVKVEPGVFESMAV